MTWYEPGTAALIQKSCPPTGCSWSTSLRSGLHLLKKKKDTVENYRKYYMLTCVRTLCSGFQVIEVGRFWGFLSDEASLEKQRVLTAEINRHTLTPLSVSLYPNLMCLAPYSENSDQSLYYRAKILHTRGSSVEVLKYSLHTAVF